MGIGNQHSLLARWGFGVLLFPIRCCSSLVGRAAQPLGVGVVLWLGEAGDLHHNPEGLTNTFKNNLIISKCCSEH